jgi:hypothetical protein
MVAEGRDMLTRCGGRAATAGLKSMAPTTERPRSKATSENPIACKEFFSVPISTSRVKVISMR